MVYSVNLKWLSFKQNISDKSLLIEDEKSTYVIMKYAHDIPQRLYFSVMDYLSTMKDALTYNKLINLVEQYEGSTRIVMTMDEEFVETIEIPVTYKPGF